MATKKSFDHSGWKSRKLWFSVFCVLVIAAVAIVAIRTESPTVHLVFEVTVGGVVAIAGLFLAGNVTGKWVSVKGQATTNQGPNPGASKQPLEQSPEESLG
jgi:hypothetical protein